MRIANSLALAALIGLGSLGQAAAQDKLQWHPDLAQARALAASTNRAILVHFWAPWCEPCLRMEHDVFGQNGLGSELNSRIVAVKVNRDREEALATQLGIRALPTDVLIAPDGRIIARITGATTSPQEYVARVTQALGQSVAAPGTASASVASPATETAAPAEQNPASDAYAEMLARKSRHAPTLPYSDTAGQVPAEPWPAEPAAHPNVETEQTAAPAVDVATVGDIPAAAAPIMSAAPIEPAMASAPTADLQPPPAAPVADPTRFNPPLGLEGFCPVYLYDEYQWVPGDVRFGAIFEGRTYLFATAEAQQKFLANPVRYSPVGSGTDAVVALEQGQAVPGRREFGVVCGGRVFLFATAQSLAKFEANPEHYTAPLMQAHRPTGTTTR